MTAATATATATAPSAARPRIGAWAWRWSIFVFAAAFAFALSVNKGTELAAESERSQRMLRNETRGYGAACFALGIYTLGSFYLLTLMCVLVMYGAVEALHVAAESTIRGNPYWAARPKLMATMDALDAALDPATMFGFTGEKSLHAHGTVVLGVVLVLAVHAWLITGLYKGDSKSGGGNKNERRQHHGNENQKNHVGPLTRAYVQMAFTTLPTALVAFYGFVIVREYARVSHAS